MIPSKLTIGELNDLETRALNNAEKCRLRWERLMAQQDKLSECRSRNDVMRLIGLDPNDYKDQRKGSSWVGNMIKMGTMEEIRTPHSNDQSSYRIIGVPAKVVGANKTRRVKRGAKGRAKGVKVVEKIVEKPVEKIVEVPVEVEKPNKEVHIVVKGKKPITIDVVYTGVGDGVVSNALASLIKKINKI